MYRCMVLLGGCVIESFLIALSGHGGGELLLGLYAEVMEIACTFYKIACS